jgi:rare lipoprotein A
MACDSLSRILFASILLASILSLPVAASAQSGIASIYWEGARTATGERVNPAAMTAAHRTLPLGTRVRITNSGTGRSVVVRINDRGPFKPGRIVDLTPAAARELGFSVKTGLARVTLVVLNRT